MLPSEVVVRIAGSALGVEPGAEISGEVVRAGDAAAEWLGKRVVVPRLLCCGDCDACRRGRQASCPARVKRGGVAPEQTLPARFLLSLDGPPSLWPASEELWRLAALADAAAAPFAALSRAGMGPGDVVAVIGQGARAAFAAAIARAKGAQPVTVDSTLAPLDAAAQLPAPEIVLETSGSAAGRHRALTMLPPGATAVFLDGPADSLKVPLPDWQRFSDGECRLLGAEAAHPDLLPEVCALAARGELPLAEWTIAIDPSQIDATQKARREGRLRQLPIVRFA
jgi:threonine dehydrogenase-like Zn-dependent dehydrogenase